MSPSHKHKYDYVYVSGGKYINKRCRCGKLKNGKAKVKKEGEYGCFQSLYFGRSRFMGFMKFLAGIFLITWWTQECIPQSSTAPCQIEWVQRRRTFTKWEGARKFRFSLLENKNNRLVEVKEFR